MNVPMVQRQSGIVVPAAVAIAVAKDEQAATGKSTTAYDEDGRRRVVFAKDDQRKIDQAIKLLIARGFGIVVMCKTRDDGKEPCGAPLLNEPGTDDPGYGCACSRIHFISNSPTRIRL